MIVWYVPQTKNQNVCVCVVMYVALNVSVMILHVTSDDHNEGDTEN